MNTVFTVDKNTPIVVSGVSKDEPREVNEKGASQSRTLYRFDLLDPSAMFEMTKVLKEGADKYGVDNWRGIDVRDHLNHLLIHAYAYLAGDKSDDHLSHIMCRAMFAQAVDIEDNMVVNMKVEEEPDLRYIKDPIYDIANNLATAYIKLCDNFKIPSDPKIQNKTGGFKGGD